MYQQFFLDLDYIDIQIYHRVTDITLTLGLIWVVTKYTQLNWIS